MRPTDAPVSQQTVPHGPASPSKQVPVQRFTPVIPRSGATPVRGTTPLQGTRLSGSQIVRPATPLIRAQRPTSKVPLVIGGIVVVAALAAGAYFLLKNNGSTETATNAGGKPDLVTKDPPKGATPSTPIAATPTPEVVIPSEIRHFTGHTGEIRCLAISPDGRLMLSGSLDHTVRLWDVETGKDLATVKMENASDIPLAVSFLPGGTNRIAVGSGQSVFIYDLDSKRVSKSIQLPGADALAFFPDGSRFCIGTDRSLEIWDLERGEKIARLSEDPVPQVRSLFVSPDGRIIVSGHGRGNVGSKSPPEFAVVLWDAGSGRRVKTLEGHTDDVTAVALASDAKRALSASFDSSIRLWDVSKAEMLHQYDFRRGVVLPALRDEKTGANIKLLMGVAFSPDGKRAVMGAAGIVSYQDVVDLSELLSLKGHKDEIVECLAFTPDGSKVFSAGGDKVVRLWKLN
jgi:WD40 repeat protein